MGAMQNNPPDKAGRKSKRGGTNNKRRLDAFKQAGASGQADWGACSAEKLQGVVQAITEMGGAVIVGLSRDRGAYSMTLLLDGGKQTLWFNGDADVDQELDDVMGTLEAMI